MIDIAPVVSLLGQYPFVLNGFSHVRVAHGDCRRKFNRRAPWLVEF
ncbi:hypothetical protein [Streptacidiphilus sp. EB129]